MLLYNKRRLCSTCLALGKILLTLVFTRIKQRINLNRWLFVLYKNAYGKITRINSTPTDSDLVGLEQGFQPQGFWGPIILCRGDYSVLSQMFSSICGFYPLDAKKNLCFILPRQFVSVRNVSRYRQMSTGDKIAPGWQQPFQSQVQNLPFFLAPMAMRYKWSDAALWESLICLILRFFTVTIIINFLKSDQAFLLIFLCM